MAYETQLAADDLEVSYMSLFEAMPGSFILLKNNAPLYTILATTPEYLKQTGTTKEGIIGKGIFEAFPGNPDDPTDTGTNDLNASLEHVRLQKKPHHLPAQRYDVAGENGSFSERYWRTINKPVFSSGGEVAFIIHNAEDITAEVKAMEMVKDMKELEESEQALRSLVLQAPIGICVIDAATLVSRIVNDSFVEIAGRPIDEIVGWMYWDTFSEARLYYEEALNNVVQHGITFRANEVEVPLIRHGKREIVHVTFVYEPLKDRRGVVKKVVVWVIDNTPQVMARRKVEESEAKFRTMAESTPVLITVGDENGNITYYNKAWTILTGKPTEELLRTAWAELVYPEDRERFVAIFLEAFANKRSFTGEFRVKNAAGDCRWLFADGVPRFDSGGNFAGYIAACTDITEHKWGQQQLETALEQVRLSKEAAELGTFDMDLEKGTMHWDNRCRILFGISHHNPVTYEKDFVGGLHPDDKERILKIIDQLFNRSIPDGIYDVEYRTIGAEDGVLRWVRAKGKVYFNSQDKPVRFIGSVLDITPQIIATRKVAESEAKYRTLFESMEQGYCTLEVLFEGERCVDYRYLEVNPTFERHVGFSNAIGKTIREMAPDIEAKWFEFYGGVALTGNPIRIEEESPALNKWFDVYAVRVGRAEERKVGVFFTDITARKKSEEALRQSEQNLRNMILQSPIAMCILKGASFVVEIANDRMYELWGRSKEELQNKSIFEGLPEVSKQGYEELLTGVYTTGKTFSALGTSVTLPRAEGIQTVYINLLYEPFREADGSISGIMVVATDVTEQVLARQKIEEMVEQRTKELANANETLLQTNKELQRSNQNLEEFAHAASHDLKEPVRKIHFFTTQLKDQLIKHLGEGEIRSFSRIESATERMRNLIDDLLLYSHVSQRPHETEVVDLNKKLQNVLEELELDIEEKRAVIQVSELPTVKGYRRQLQQMFQNLISNALKYSKPGVPPQITISASVVTENNIRYNLIKVKDNGIGFEQEYADKIFQIFTRLHSKADYGGTGVGLSIVKKVVENHNGLVRVESILGEGSTFNVLLPVTE